MELWVTRSDGRDEKRLVTVGQFSQMRANSSEGVLPTALHWVPRTHIIAFHTNLAATWLGFFYTPNDLWWVDVESGQLTKKPVNGDIAYSPNGQRAAVLNADYMFLMNSDGSDQRAVNLENYHTIPHGSSYNEPPRVHWAKDSQSLFVIVPEASGLIESAAPTAMITIWQINFDDALPIKIGNYYADYARTTFSPDHTFITYVRSLNPSGLELHLAQINGLGDIVIFHQVVTNNSSVLGDASWSPDSQRFIFWGSGIPYKGDVCEGPHALLNEAVLTSWGDPVVGSSAVWVNDTQYLLTVGDPLEGLYVGRIDQSQYPPTAVGSRVASFDWTMVREGVYNGRAKAIMKILRNASSEFETPNHRLQTTRRFAPSKLGNICNIVYY